MAANPAKFRANLDRPDDDSYQLRAAHFLMTADTVAPMTQAEALEVLQYMHPLFIPAGETFIVEDDVTQKDFLVLILEGNVVVEHSMGACHSLTMNVIPPGRWIGELSMLDGQARMASSRADESTNVLGAMLTRTDFVRLLRERPELAAKLTLVLAYNVTRYLREVHQKLMRMAEIQAAQRWGMD